MLVEPQYSVVLPGQMVLHCVSKTTVLVLLRSLPHQHWDPLSRPAYWYLRHAVRHLPTVILVVLVSTSVDRRLPDDGSW